MASPGRAASSLDISTIGGLNWSAAARAEEEPSRRPPISVGPGRARLLPKGTRGIWRSEAEEQQAPHALSDCGGASIMMPPMMSTMPPM